MGTARRAPRIAALPLVALVALAAGAVPTATAWGATAPECTNAGSLRTGPDRPSAARTFDPGTGLVGDGAIWTLPGIEATDLVYSPPEDVWRLKLPWFRTRTGAPRLTVRRLDGDGTGGAEVPSGRAYPGTGFIPTLVTFPAGGCWQVTARFRGSVAKLVVAVPRGRTAICAELDRQSATRIDTPANRTYYEALDADATRLGCGAGAAVG